MNISHFNEIIFHVSYPLIYLSVIVRQWSWRLASIPGRIIVKDSWMVLDTALLNTQHYKIRIKDKLEQPREWSSAHPYTSV